MQKRCLALYSGGLDSILSIIHLRKLGVEVVPLYFATPFFGLGALIKPEHFKSEHLGRYGIRPEIIDYSDDFIKILLKPDHGYGKHMNPCIDCKIGMMKKSKGLLEEYNASFVITGEVTGQRPMSQRRDALNIIERESGLKGILLRPLCAKHMPETVPECMGIVNREDMLDIAGRGRKMQKELAFSFGISKENIPAPAGGCLLTYVHIAEKVRQTIQRFGPKMPLKADFLMDVVGRKFILDDKTVMIVPRDEEENSIAEGMEYPGNVFLKIENIPGPSAVMRGEINNEKIKYSAGICLRYTKAKGICGHIATWGESFDNRENIIEAPVIEENLIRASSS